MRYLAKKSREIYLKKLNARLERETKIDYYSCSNKCSRLDFERATEVDFKCPECGSLLHQKDNKEIIENLEKEIKEVKRKIS